MLTFIQATQASLRLQRRSDSGASRDLSRCSTHAAPLAAEQRAEQQRAREEEHRRHGQERVRRTSKPSLRRHSLWASMNLAHTDSSPWVMKHESLRAPARLWRQRERTEGGGGLAERHSAERGVRRCVGGRRRQQRRRQRRT